MRCPALQGSLNHQQQLAAAQQQAEAGSFGGLPHQNNDSSNMSAGSVHSDGGAIADLQPQVSSTHNP